MSVLRSACTRPGREALHKARLARRWLPVAALAGVAVLGPVWARLAVAAAWALADRRARHVERLIMGPGPLEPTGVAHLP